MLEKIGLPPKPSMRGAAWVLDASNCQGCSSQFTFFNRKHHCRRCGGLFCNNCTQQRMFLRGQGDSPVRICDPCKKLEEAVRFEARHGHRNRISKGGSRTAAKSESEILEQILGSDGKSQIRITSESTGYDHLDHQRVADDASSSKLQEGDDMSHSRLQNYSNNNFLDSIIYGGDEKDSFTPEELRQQAQEEKKKYSILKREGKGEEAIQAFKRGKELERQSDALELSLRKSRKNAARERKQEYLVDPESKVPGTSKDAHELESSIVENKKKSLKQGRDEKDDITSALKELGWSDADLQDADKKQNRMSLEGELSRLVSKSHNSEDGSPGKESVGGANQMQVLAHKRKALALKREGKLAEAKEELKKAKIIEKQLEEQEMIGQEEESDDELAVLIRGLDEEKIGRPLGRLGEKFAEESLFNLSQFATMGDECDVNAVEVTDDDINDPGISAALRSIGWTEEADTLQKLNGPFVRSNEQSMDKSVARRTGSDNAANGYFEGSPISSTQPAVDATCPTRQDRAALQQNILSLKRDALRLKRAGNVAEAMEQLRRAKVLEKELENLQSQDSVESVQLDFEASYSLEKRKPRSGQVGKISYLPDQNASMMMFDEKYEESVEVTDEDMGDPELVRVLKDLGWQEGDQAGALGNNSGNLSFLPSQSVNDYSVVPPIQSSKTKAELRRELLGLKRKALALKREGRIEESEEELRKGKLLEQQLEEIESLQQTGNTRSKALREVSKPSSEGRGGNLGVLPVQMEEDTEVTEQDLQDPAILAALRSMGWSDDNDELERKDSVTPSRVSYSGEFSSQTRHKKLEFSQEGQRSQSNFRGQKLLEEERVSAIGRIHDREDTSLPLNTKKEQKENCSLESVGHGHVETGLDVELLPPLLSQKNKKATPVQVSPFQAEAQPVKTMDLLTGDNWKPSPSGPGEVSLNYRDGASGTDVLSSTSDIFLGTNVVVQVKATGPPVVSPGQTLQHEKRAQKMKTWRPNASDILLGKNETEGNVNTVRNPDIFPGQNLPQKTDVHKRKSVIPDSSEVLVETNAIDSNTKVSKSPATLVENLQQQTLAHETKSISSNAGDTLGGAITTEAHANAVMSTTASPAQNLQQEILSHKRKAVALKREGKLAEAREKLRSAKLLERELELQKNSAGHNGFEFASSSVVDGVNIPKLSSKAQTTENQIQEGTTHIVASSQTAMQLGPDSAIESISVSSVGSKTSASMKKQQISNLASSKNRMKLQQESLAHKRRALALRREGKLAESEAEFELAKSLENQMEELSDNNAQSHLSIGNIGTDDVDLVDGILDPQLLSALKGIGWKDSDIFSQTSEKGVQGKNKGSVSVSGIGILGNNTPLENANTSEALREERSQLEEKIRAEKLRALDLKRAGRQAEALDAFRAAKQLEKKLQSFSP